MLKFTGWLVSMAIMAFWGGVVYGIFYLMMEYGKQSLVLGIATFSTVLYLQSGIEAYKADKQAQKKQP